MSARVSSRGCGWDGMDVAWALLIMNASRIKRGRKGRGIVRIGLSAVVVTVLAAFPPAPATKDLISNNGQYKQQEERTILISPPHAMPFPCPCLSLSSLFPSRAPLTRSVNGRWIVQSGEGEGERGRVVSGWSMEAACLGNGGMGEEGEGEGGRNCISGGRPPSLPTLEG